MSDSDDTDVLLLIPPDLFTVASSQSEDSLEHYYYSPKDNTSVSELRGHVQLLEDRINAIETRDNSLNPLLHDETLSESQIYSVDNHSDSLHEQYLGYPKLNITQPSMLCQRKYCTKLDNVTLPKSLSNSSLLFKSSEHKRNDIISGLGDFSRNTMSDNMAFTTVRSPAIATINTDRINSDAINLSQQLMNFNNNVRDTNSSKTILNDSNGVLMNENDQKEVKFDKNHSIYRMHDALPVQCNGLPSCKNTNGDLLVLSERNSKSDRIISSNVTSTPKKHNLRDSIYCITDTTENSNAVDLGKNTEFKSMENTNDPLLNTEYQPWKSSRLISLSDFWIPNPNHTEEDAIRIKLEEEKCRRQHCEKLIQELQKKLLEQQEKVAVAIQVDKEKSDIISQFQMMWNKFKQRWNSLEMNHNKLQSSVEIMKKNYEDEIENLKSIIKTKDDEISRIMNLMNECENKRDAAINEKIRLLESHANELDKNRSLVQAAENRYESIKIDYDKLMEEHKNLEQINKSVKQELYKECLKSGEVRTEMTVIHKALDTCEAELTVLRQEKENLLLKLKEEDNRNNILEKNKIQLIDEANNAKKSENLIKEEIKSLITQQEVKRSELREIYQNQVDEVVNIKLKEFQSQLDAAELTFQMELDAKQRAIAECAARKIKNIIDKHQLEINLLEEKHREEKRLYEIRLSQTTKKTMALETQLNAQHNAKSRLADQLHSLMEKQYHKALQIISTENITGSYQASQQSNNDKLINVNNMIKKSDDFNEMLYNEPVKLAASKFEKKPMDYPSDSRQYYDESSATFVSGDESPANKLIDSKDDLKKYIKMILQMQEPQKYNSKNDIIDNNSSNSLMEVCQEVPRKYYSKVEIPNEPSDVTSSSRNIGQEKTPITNTDLLSYHENKYFPIRTITHMEKQKPPWK